MVASRGTVSGAAAALLLLLGIIGAGVARAQLQVGFYSDSCPDAEDIVTAAVQDAANNDPTILPALLRLQFHDCFVKVPALSPATSCLRVSSPAGRRWRGRERRPGN
jgi:peroxidase